MSTETESKTYVFGQDSNSIVPMLTAMLNNKGCDPSVLAMLNNNKGFLGDNNLLALIILFAIFGGGFGNFGFCGNNNSVNSDLIMQTLNRNGLDINSIASTLGTSTSNVVNGINALGIQVQNVGNQVGMSSQSIINAIQSGNCSIANQLAQCCCENKQLITTQGYENRLATLEQTNVLGSKIDQQTTFLSDKFCELEKRELTSKINTLESVNNNLQNQIANLQQNELINNLGVQIAAIQAKLNSTATTTTTA